EQTDPDLLVGLVNTALRNHHESLEDFCLTHNIDAVLLAQRLAEGDYKYLPSANQFR
ncbi:MAG: DUF4250 domain-containing protein, partial [Verrucomicrobiota bacterium]